MSPILSSCGNAAAKAYGMFASTGLAGGGWLSTVAHSSSTYGGYYRSTRLTSNRSYVDVSSSKIHIPGYWKDGSPISVVNNNINLNDGSYIITDRTYDSTAVYTTGVERDPVATKIDSSGNKYIVTWGSNSSGTNTYAGSIIKATSANSFAWQMDIVNGTGTSSAEFYGFTINSSDEAICVGTKRTSTGAATGLIVKFSTSGAISWQRSLSNSAGVYVVLNDVTTDSSGNVYACGNVAANADATGATRYTNACIVKYNSSGVLQSQKTFGDVPVSGTSQEAYDFRKILVDDAGNIYAVGNRSVLNNSYNTGFTVVKYNSSFVVQWVKEFVATTGTYYENWFNDIKLDSNYLYITGNFNVGSGLGTDGIVVKLDTSGNVVWQFGFNGNQPLVSIPPSGTPEHAGFITNPSVHIIPSSDYIVITGLTTLVRKTISNGVTSQFTTTGPSFAMKLNQTNFPTGVHDLEFSDGTYKYTSRFNFYTPTKTFVSPTITSVTQTLTDAAGGVTAVTQQTSAVYNTLTNAILTQY